ncbi:EamA family transporter [Nocardioides jishulii]|uniref:EamA family transporter n=1 Tax=Nocardioides jishulii TaxID=2575440 RepID=A0A4U2YT38_9ACTN|nr:EamA family transporter [Nocardioides jishulii]QCX26221.1 EamA family transporter [Nocardioides jishulii]TKI63975.1 EamA family transporter [Nocardioides jishulii]
MDPLRTTLVTASAPLVWGTTYVVTTELLPPGHPLFASLVRALPAGVLAIALTRALPTGAWWWRSAVLGVLNIGVFFPLLFVAAYRLPGGVAATLGAAQPLVVAILVVIVLREPLSTWRLSWGIVGIVGVALVVLRSTATLDGMGVAAGLLSAVSMGFGVTFTKKWGRPAGVPAMALAGWQLTAGGLFVLPVTLLHEGLPTTIDTAGAAGCLWLGLIGGLATYTLWFSGIARLPVASVAALGLLSPLVAAALGALLLSQALSTVQLVGFGVALTAVVASQVAPRTLRPAPDSRHTPAAYSHAATHVGDSGRCTSSESTSPGENAIPPALPSWTVTAGCWPSPPSSPTTRSSRP